MTKLPVKTGREFKVVLPYSKRVTAFQVIRNVSSRMCLHDVVECFPIVPKLMVVGDKGSAVSVPMLTTASTICSTALASCLLKRTSFGPDFARLLVISSQQAEYLIVDTQTHQFHLAVGTFLSFHRVRFYNMRAFPHTLEYIYVSCLFRKPSLSFNRFRISFLLQVREYLNGPAGVAISNQGFPLVNL